MADFDVAVVGAGPCGLAAAVALKQAGISAVVFDRASLVSSIALYPTYVTFFSTPEKLAIGGVPFTIATEKPTRRDGLEYYRKVAAKHALTLRLYHTVEHIERTGDGFTVHARPRDAAAESLRTKAVVIATGYFGSPNMLGVPGEELPHVTHRFVEGHEAFGRTALVVGGGNSAVEASLDLVRSGAGLVTLVHFGPTFDHVIKPWILPEFEARVASGAIVVRWNTHVTAIERSHAHLATPTGPATVRADHVYLMTGYTPSPGLLGALGVRFDAKTGVPAHNPKTMESAVRGVFIAGVIASGNDANSVFIENGRDHGTLIAKALRKR